ncbi:ketopantoate reductase family protein [Tepidamorphus sp. 3E244]|uniref:ketopantoate reductase family protein n=1 Tax=Tepidamorphus sp. 3E244 TaxID=3385498 RepID=UPI0038FC9017
MKDKLNILLMGASYGSLLGAKLLMAGHKVTFVCLPAEADLINSDGIRVNLPVRGREKPVAIHSKKLPGACDAAAPGDVDPAGYDLVGLAMQEPQYGSPGVVDLLDKVAKARVPCMSIMNMPPLPYLKRIPGLDTSQLGDCFTAPEAWQNFEPGLVTLCSPDPQAFRPPDQPANVLQVGLPTNFKVARFKDDAHTAILQKLQDDILAARYEVDGQMTELPVKLKLHDSLYVPFAKWSMLLTGNYRCVRPEGAVSIFDAVHGDLDKSRKIYLWVDELVQKLGASPADKVPFEKYANAALSLLNPSSAARALNNGAKNIERVDRLVQKIAAQNGMSLDAVDEVVATVDKRLEENRAKG